MGGGEHPDAQGPRPELQTVTSSSLLEGLKDAANRTRWQAYVDRYRPLIVAFCRGRGLDGEEAEDLAQTALLEFSRAYRDGRYDAARGRLRSWLFGIVYRQLLNYRRSRRARAPGSAPLETRHLEELSDEDELEGRWDEEWRKAVLGQSLAEIRAMVQPQTYSAFEEFALQERPAAEVARELGITENAVFGAKRRVLQRLREILPLMESAW